MNITNKIIPTGLLGLLAATALMVGYTQAEAQEQAETPPKFEMIRGEGTGIIADVGIVSATMFEFDSWKLKEEGKAALEAYRKKLGPNFTKAIKVIIVGHTDNTGDEGHNMALSLSRANSVADYLIATGTNADIVRTLGRGPNDPIASNETREGREQNRRVDITVIAEVRALDKMVFPGGILFKRDSADINDEGKEFLTKHLTARAQSKRVKYIEIIGHTDDKWEDDYNMELSEKRAASVRDYLASQGVDASKMVTTGMGETMPIVSNNTKKGRAQNRRVEILIVGRAQQ
ncbi:MAG: OmpA family protein [Gammaproteobacteria bacterium]|nr:OmpA family protein [Gammaproteobacteria bacterium]